MNFIYILSDPRDNQIRYVGKTDNPQRRFSMHLIEKDPCYKRNWIKQLLSNNLQPIMTVIEEIPENQDWEEREKYWISYYRSTGHNLTNMTDGGDCGPDCTGKHLIKSDIGRQNIIDALVKRNKSEEMRNIARKNGQHNKGKKRPKEAIEKQRITMTGKKIHTDEFKNKLSERNKTRKYNPEIMRENSRKLWDDPIKGQEARDKLSKRNKNRKHSNHTENNL